MADAYLDGGFNYFDTAYVYGGSEEKLKKALTSRHKRDKYLLADKMPPWSVSNLKDCDNVFAESLKRCGVDYFDFYLVHSMDENNYRKAQSVGIFEWAAKQKKKGAVRHVGFSFHGDTALLEKILAEHPETEFVQLQLNYLDALRGQAGEWHAAAVKHKIPIIVMEPVKGGTLASLPPAAEALFKNYAPDKSIASWAIRYAAGMEGVTCVLSGMSSLEQVNDNLKSFTPLERLSSGELKVIDDVLRELSKDANIPCTACKYCVADCPQGVEIPLCFSLYNETERAGAQFNRNVQYKAIPKGNRAHDCIDCGACVPLCPQHIDIPARLKDVVGKFNI